MMTPARTYERRRKAFEKLMERQQRWESRLSNLRLATVAVGLAAGVFAYRAHSPAASLAVFVYLAFRHAGVAGQLRRSAALSAINRQGEERAAGRWTAFADTGAEFRVLRGRADPLRLQAAARRLHHPECPVPDQAGWDRD